MFSKNDRASARKDGSSAGTRSRVPSILSNDLRITGGINSDGELQVDGLVDGDVAAGSLVVGESGRINGAVDAKRVQVLGCVEGRISAGEVVVNASGRVVGDIEHEVLTIERGAFVDGHCRRRPTPDAKGGEVPVSLVFAGANANAPVGEEETAEGVAEPGGAKSALSSGR